jgi:hypothetical protein
MPKPDTTLDAALDAIKRGYQIIPINATMKRPMIGNWPHITWPADTTADTFLARLKDEWGFDPNAPFNLGVILGPASGELVDVDIDDHRAKRFRSLLPHTLARSGRTGSPDSHYWYIVEDDPQLPAGNIPSTRRYKLADKQTVTIEYRYNNGVQTVIPPSDWVPKDWEDQGKAPQLVEVRNWTRGAWGGDSGPARVTGRRLATQVALIALATSLLDGWPAPGSRHEAYLALAGALMRQADGVVHQFWAKNAEVLIQALADATNDDDAKTRVDEAIPSTIQGIRDGKMIWGWPKLAELIGDDQVTNAKILAAEVEALAGFVSRQAPSAPVTPAAPAATVQPGAAAVAGTTLPGAATNTTPDPGEDGEPVDVPPVVHTGTWLPLDLEPYLNGTFVAVEPTVLRRADGHAMFYPGRLNMLFAPSESGKTMIALYAVLETIQTGAHAMFIDFEDEPVNTIGRLRSMGAALDDIRTNFSYIRPDEPIATMQRDHWGNHKATKVGEASAEAFAATMREVDPVLIIADGMTSIYGLHGLDSNNSVETDVITSWLKSLSRDGRATVILIDHMAKAGDRGSMPIGSQHKVSMVQGSLLQVWPKQNQQPVKGGIGEVELIVLKDRPGEVRRYAGGLVGRAQVAAEVIIDSSGKWPDGSDKTVFTIKDPPPRPNTNTNPTAPGAQAAPAAAPAIVTKVTGKTSARTKAAIANNLNKLQVEALQEKIYLAAWGNVAGTRLTSSEIQAAVWPTWLAQNWTSSAYRATHVRLLADKTLRKNGPQAGPGIDYELLPGGVK